MEKFKDIDCGQAKLVNIWDEYVEQCDSISKDEGKAYFREWSGKIPPKLMRQAMFAGMAYALQHPDQVHLV